MIEKLVEEAVEHLEQEFYKKKFRFSYSSINKLLFSPVIFHQLYILGHKPEQREGHLVEGSVIHCLLLEKDTFDDRYIVSPTNLPKDPAKLVIDTVYKKNKRVIDQDPSLDLEYFEYTILETLIAINLHQSLKLDSARLEKIITPQNISYFEFLKNKDNKELIDESTYQYCEGAVEIIKSTPGVKELLGLTSRPNIEVFNEEYLEWDLPGEKFGIKGILDNMVVDHDAKTIFVNDFKTTSKSLDQFPETVEFWNYWMQAAIYVTLVSEKYAHLGYRIKFTFLVCDKYFNVYPFEVTSGTMIQWIMKLQNIISDDVKYHYDNNRYGLPAKYDTGIVKL